MSYEGGDGDRGGQVEGDGWRPDPFGAYDLRLFRAGEPTCLVKTDGIGRVDPVSLDDRRRALAVAPVTVLSQSAPLSTAVGDGGPVHIATDARRIRVPPQRLVRMALVFVVVGAVVAAVGFLSDAGSQPNRQGQRPGASTSATVPDTTLTSLERALAALPRTTTLSQIEEELLALPKSPTETTVAQVVTSLPPSTTVGAFERALAAAAKSSRTASPNARRPTGGTGTGTTRPGQSPSAASTGTTAGGGGPLTSPLGTAPSGGRPASSSAPPRVMVVVMENASTSSVLGNTQMPYVNSLASNYGLATESYGLAHPSLPDYLALVSGSNQGVTADLTPATTGIFAAPTLATQLTAAGFTVKAYAENLPASPSADAGEYAVRHFPWAYFTSPPAIADSTSLMGDLNSANPPDFVWYTPNLIDDQHDGTPAQADAFLSTFITAVQSTSWYATGGQIIIEYDEGADSDTTGINGGNGGHVVTIVVSWATRLSPKQSAVPVDTIGILHSIEDVYGLAHLGGSSADGGLGGLLIR